MRSKIPNHCTRSSESASVLIAVFWLMVAMGITIFGAMVVLKSDLEVVGTEKASFRALQLAEMGIAVAAHNGIEKYDNILSQPPGIEKDPALSDFFEFESDEGFEVEIRKEASLINPNYYLLRPSPENLKAMADVFQSWGMELSEAQEVVHCLLDWVDADEVTTAAPEGAELEWYEKEGLGGGNYPFNRAFYDVDEMQFVKGMDLVAQYKPNWRDYFTVKSQGALDINDAPANVIAVAAGILEMDDIGGSDYSEKVLEIQEFLEGPSGRNGEDGIKDTEDDVNIDTGLLIQELIRLDPPSPEQLSSRFTSNGNTLRIISTGIKGEYRRQIAVVLRNRGTRPTIISREEIFVK